MAQCKSLFWGKAAGGSKETAAYSPAYSHRLLADVSDEGAEPSVH